MYRVVVTINSPVQSKEFLHKSDFPDRDKDSTLEFSAEDGIKHVFYKHSIVHIAYIPTPEP